MERRRRLLGGASADTLSSINLLANLHTEAGNHAAALPLYEEDLAGSRQTLGPSHPDTLIAMQACAAAHVRLRGDYTHALPLL